jgi:hypothetical protein
MRFMPSLHSIAIRSRYMERAEFLHDSAKAGRLLAFALAKPSAMV